jgi:hypothetical protein
MRFSSTNLCTEDATVLTASSSNANFPVSNLKNPFRSKRWRTADADTDHTVVFDFQTAQDITCIGVLWPKEDGIRLSDSAVITIEANATNVWTSPAVSQVLTVDDNYVIASHFFSSSQSYRYWRLKISDVGNAYGYIEIGQVWIGEHLDIQAPENGFKFKITDPSVITKTSFGQEYVDEYPQMDQIDFDYKYMYYEDYQILENMYRENGTRKPVFVAFDDTEAVFDKDHFLIYGKMQKSFDGDHVSYNLFNTGLKITEIG